jgi:hypothetical protein
MPPRRGRPARLRPLELDVTIVTISRANESRERHLLAATNGAALLGWILVAVGVVLFVIGAAISIIVALRTDPPAGTTADEGTPNLGTIIGWIFKYGGAGAPLMAVGFALFATGLSILGYKIFTWPSS